MRPYLLKGHERPLTQLKCVAPPAVAACLDARPGRPVRFGADWKLVEVVSTVVCGTVQVQQRGRPPGQLRKGEQQGAVLSIPALQPSDVASDLVWLRRWHSAGPQPVPMVLRGWQASGDFQWAQWGCGDV